MMPPEVLPVESSYLYFATESQCEGGPRGPISWGQPVRSTGGWPGHVRLLYQWPHQITTEC